MRVVVLGGAGHMGRYAVAALAPLPFVDELVVADRDGDGARRQAQAVAGVPACVDVTDAEQLTAILEGCDAVVSTVGPFFRFGTTILDAALSAGCHYVDICDDPGPTLQLLERDERAREADVCAIVGAGASPGISNLLAVLAAQGLDDIDTLLTGWGTGGPDDDADTHPDGATAAIEHWVEQLSGPIPIHQGGEQVQGDPLQPVTVRLPGGPPVTAFTVGHPEPVTLPRTFPSIRYAINVMDMPQAVMVLVRDAVAAVESGRLSVGEASRMLSGALYGGKMGPGGARGTARAVLAATRERIRGKAYLPQLFALAIGTQAGRGTTRVAALNGTIPGGMGPLTCVPAAVMLTMLADGEIERRGVFAPEAGVDPERFFARLASHVVVADGTYRGAGPVRVVTETWTGSGR